MPESKWLSAFEVDFNNPLGFFVIKKAAPDFESPESRPKVDQEIFICCMESETFPNPDFGFCDSGFGMVVKVTEIKEIEDSFVYYTDYPERTWKK